MSLVGALVCCAACMRPAFQRYIDEERWSDARTAFESDTSLMNKDWALLGAARIYSSPTRGAYDPRRARMLLQRLLAQNPQSKYRGEALDRLALIESMLRQRDSITAERQGLDDRIAQLTTETKRLRASLDSATSRNDSLQHAMTRVEADLKDREDQLRALRLELARLKQIDLNQRPAARPPRF